MAMVVANSFSAQDSTIEVKPEELIFENNKVRHQHLPQLEVDFKEAVNMSYLERTSLSATGFYKTPDIHFDRDKGFGKPYHYYAFGMAVTEITLDLLTGHFTNERGTFYMTWEIQSTNVWILDR